MISGMTIPRELVGNSRLDRTRFYLDIPRTHLPEAGVVRWEERNFRNLPIRPMGIDRPQIWRISQLSSSSSFASTRESWKIEQHAAEFSTRPGKVRARMDNEDPLYLKIPSRNFCYFYYFSLSELVVIKKNYELLTERKMTLYLFE